MSEEGRWPRWLDTHLVSVFLEQKCLIFCSCFFTDLCCSHVFMQWKVRSQLLSMIPLCWSDFSERFVFRLCWSRSCLVFLFPLPVLLDLASFSSPVELLLKQSFHSLACASTRLCAARHSISYFIRIRAYRQGAFMCWRSSLDLVFLLFRCRSRSCQRARGRPWFFTLTSHSGPNHFLMCFLLGVSHLVRSTWQGFQFSSLICHQRP
jgi:hypothetical protein